MLTDLGLSTNSAEIYLASLSLGPSSILFLARETGIKRTTIYSIVDDLIRKGLMRIEVRGFKKFFAAENPERLEHMLELRQKQIGKFLPELQALYNLKKGESIIKYYDGPEAVKSVYEEILREIQPHEEYLSVGNPTQWFPLDARYLENFMERRAELSRGLNFTIRLLLKESEKAFDLKKYEKNYNEKIKILPKDVSFSSNLIILQRKIVIHQLTAPIKAIVVENESTAQLQRELFNIIWRSIGE